MVEVNRLLLLFFLLEIQLKPCQILYKIYQKWPAFLTRFTNAEDHEILLDEPLIVLRRNVLLTLDREIQVFFYFLYS